MSGLRFDPELVKAISARGPALKSAPSQNVHHVREHMNNFLTVFFAGAERPEAVEQAVWTVQSHDGADIEITRFATPEVLNSEEPTTAVVFVHGGGLVAGSVKIFNTQIAEYAHNSGVPFFAVGYRLAPEYPAPNGVEDVYAALKYVSEHASELNVDPTRIAVAGDSAGGGIAAGVALLARDRGFSPPLAKQILVYPMLDDCTELAADDNLLNFLAWKNDDNVLAWNAYIGEDKRGKLDADVSPYAAPARAETLRGLPPTYIDVGTLDLYRDENIAYAARLAKDEVEVEFHLWPGVPHGFDGFKGIHWSNKASSSRMEAIKRIGV